MPAMLRMLAVAILLITGSVALCQEPRQMNRESKDVRLVRQLEDAIADATDRNDANALDALWAPDYIFVNPFGLVLTKAQRLDLFRSGRMKLESYSRDQETIRVYGKTAVVIYRSTVRGQRGTEDISSQRRVTTVLLKRGGRWQAVSQQSTTIGAPR
jgi:ketosteroid isomerase-like protein